MRGAVDLHMLALSDSTGTMELHDFENDDGSTQASLGAASVGMFTDRTVAHQVEVTTLDEFAVRHGIERIAFLKIDTEGFDVNVLRGARQLLAEGRIGPIQFEFIPACIAMRVTMRDFFEVLPGYDLHRLMVDGSLLPMLRYDTKRHEVYVIHNIVALPRVAGVSRTAR